MIRPTSTTYSPPVRTTGPAAAPGAAASPTGAASATPTVAALAARTQAPEPTAQSPLSADEQQAIDRFFPPAPALALRLYGPQGGTETVQPQAVGSLLDLKG